MNRSLYIVTLLCGLVLAGCDSTNSTTQFKVALSASPAEGGSVSPANGEYDEGKTLEISAAPNQGWRFVKWSGDFNGTNSTATITVDTDKDIEAIFAKKSYALTVTSDGQGTVREELVQQKTTDYEYGSIVKLTAEPTNGWEFMEWHGDVTDQDNPVQITVDDPKQVTAVFQKKTFSLTVNITGQGSITKNPDQQKYEYGTTVDLTASAASGWKFEKWKGDITSTGNPIQITIDAAKAVTVTFVEQSKKLFYLAENGVTIMCPDADVGDTGMVNGTVYTKRNKGQITDSNAQTTCTSGITDIGYLFYEASSFNQDISSWDVSSVEDMGGLFFKASSFNGDISNWDVANVNDMSAMFLEALSFNKDLGNWNVSNVTNMENMFDEAESFNQFIGNWDVGNVTNMVHMFRKATSFNGDISSWNVSSVTNMRGMFSQATLFNGKINSWDVSNVTKMDYMFTSASSFDQDLNNWDISRVIAMDGMFSRATSFNGDISNWDVSNVERMEYMFNEAESFNQFIGNWDVGNVTDMRFMFYEAEFFNQDLSSWCVSNISSHPPSFAAGSNLENSHLPQWGTCPQ